MQGQLQVNKTTKQATSLARKKRKSQSAGLGKQCFSGKEWVRAQRERHPQPKHVARKVQCSSALCISPEAASNTAACHKKARTRFVLCFLQQLLLLPTSSLCFQEVHKTSCSWPYITTNEQSSMLREEGNTMHSTEKEARKEGAQEMYLCRCTKLRGDAS